MSYGKKPPNYRILRIAWQIMPGYRSYVEDPPSMIPVQANTWKKIHLFLPFGDYADIGHSNRPSKLGKHSLVMYNPWEFQQVDSDYLFRVNWYLNCPYSTLSVRRNIANAQRSEMCLTCNPSSNLHPAAVASEGVTPDSVGWKGDSPFLSAITPTRLGMIMIATGPD
jgi:hypothetical protein